MVEWSNKSDLIGAIVTGVTDEHKEDGQFADDLGSLTHMVPWKGRQALAEICNTYAEYFYCTRWSRVDS